MNGLLPCLSTSASGDQWSGHWCSPHASPPSLLFSPLLLISSLSSFPPVHSQATRCITRIGAQAVPAVLFYIWWLQWGNMGVCTVHACICFLMISVMLLRIRLLDKVDLCCHMIQKERMVHAARAKAAAANARIAS